MPLVRPLCQKPPSPMIAIARLSAFTLKAEAEAIAHRGRADIERRQDREQMTADIGCDVMGAEILFDQLHRRKNRSLRTAGAEARRARRHHFGQRPDLVVAKDRWIVRRADLV